MPCGSCGQRRAVISHEQAQQAALGEARKIEYTVTAPDGTSQTFDKYIDAVVHKRKVNGVLTTFA